MVQIMADTIKSRESNAKPLKPLDKEAACRAIAQGNGTRLSGLSVQALCRRLQHDPQVCPVDELAARATAKGLSRLLEKARLRCEGTRVAARGRDLRR